jgi:hypothetical protein
MMQIRVGGLRPRGQSLLRQQVGCALLPAPSPWVRAEPRWYAVDPAATGFIHYRVVVRDRTT